MRRAQENRPRLCRNPMYQGSYGDFTDLRKKAGHRPYFVGQGLYNQRGVDQWLPLREYSLLRPGQWAGNFWESVRPCPIRAYFSRCLPCEEHQQGH